jgi:flagellar biosynthesis/type III secretory pathway protein FliH
MELWGDGTEFGMSPDMIGAMNNAFREVAMRFAAKVMEIEYQEGYNDGHSDGYSSGYDSAYYEIENETFRP